MIRRFASWALASSSVSLVLFFTPAATRAAELRDSPVSDAHACASAPESFLAGRLAIWQRRLELAGWKISIRMSHSVDLKPGTLGHIEWDTARKTAVIRVLDASDYHLPCRDMLADMELTVVHELIHLELSALPRSPASRREEEFAVNRIADALLEVERQKTPSTAAAPAP